MPFNTKEGVAPTDLSEYEDYKSIATRIEGIKNTKEGAPVPAIKTTATLDGNEFNINSLRGKYVLIDFWGIWCGPCVKEMPEVKDFQEKYKDKLVVLGINSGDTKEKVQKFVDENNNVTIFDDDDIKRKYVILRALKELIIKKTADGRSLVWTKDSKVILSAPRSVELISYAADYLTTDDGVLVMEEIARRS